MSDNYQLLPTCRFDPGSRHAPKNGVSSLITTREVKLSALSMTCRCSCPLFVVQARALRGDVELFMWAILRPSLLNSLFDDEMTVQRNVAAGISGSKP